MANLNDVKVGDTMTVHDLALIRRAVLTVINDGDPLCDSEPWELYAANYIEGLSVNQTTANQQRLDFTDAICKYIVDRTTKEQP